MDHLYLKTKAQIVNLENVHFSKEEWEWYCSNAVEKRLKQFSKKEASFIKAFVHLSHAKELVRGMNQQMDAVLVR